MPLGKNARNKSRRKNDKDRARRLEPYLQFIDDYGKRKKLPRVRKKKRK